MKISHFAFAILIGALLTSCQKESIVTLVPSSGLVNLGSSTYELKSGYHSNNWGDLSYLGDEIILAGPTVYFDDSTGLFNSTGSSFFFVTVMPEGGQFKPGEYNLTPNQTGIFNEFNPKPTDLLKDAPQPVGDLIDAKMTVSDGKFGATVISLTGTVFVNKVRTELKLKYEGTLSKIPAPYHPKN